MVFDKHQLRLDEEVMPKPRQEVRPTVIVEIVTERYPVIVGFPEELYGEELYVDAESFAHLGADNVPLIGFEPLRETTTWTDHWPDPSDIPDADLDPETLAKYKASKRLGEITVGSISGGEMVDIEDGSVYSVIPTHFTALPVLERQQGSTPTAKLRVYEFDNPEGQ